MKQRLNITLSRELIGEVEDRRGLATKSALIENELRKSFGLPSRGTSTRSKQEG